MKRIAFMLSLFCVLGYAQQPAHDPTQPEGKLYERFETKTDDGGQTLRFFDKNNAVTSEIIADKTGHISIHT